MVESTPWLSVTEQAIWRDWLSTSAALSASLGEQLRSAAGLSLSDYDVLVALSEADDGRLRASDLAASLTWTRSRCSHHIVRMAKRSLVEREECETDGRGAWIVITPTGATTIEQAAPAHVRAVRSALFDRLDHTEIGALKAILHKLDSAPGSGLADRDD